MSDQYAKDAATIADLCERDGEHSAAATIRGLLDERSDSLSKWGQIAELESQLASLTEENETAKHVSKTWETHAKAVEGNLRLLGEELSATKAQLRSLTEERDEAIAHAWDFEGGEAYYRLQRQIAEARDRIASGDTKPGMGGEELLDALLARVTREAEGVQHMLEVSDAKLLQATGTITSLTEENARLRIAYSDCREARDQHMWLEHGVLRNPPEMAVNEAKPPPLAESGE
jgi:chromosome segregation ATPase